MPTRSFTVRYQSGKEVQVRRLTPAKLPELASLLQAIFEKFYEMYDYSPYCLGDVLADPACWGYMEQIAAMLPVEGQPEPGIDLSLIGDDYEQIGQIFLTQSIDLKTGEIKLPEPGTVILPSHIAELHNQTFFKIAAVKAVQTRSSQQTE